MPNCLLKARAIFVCSGRSGFKISDIGIEAEREKKREREKEREREREKEHRQTHQRFEFPFL